MELPDRWSADHNWRGYMCGIPSPMVDPSIHIRALPIVCDSSFGRDRQRFRLVARVVDDGKKSQPPRRMVVGPCDAVLHHRVWSGDLQERTRASRKGTGRFHLDLTGRVCRV